MKTYLTLEIENALRTYEANSNKARGRNLAFEVPVVNGTPHGGLIDAVEITEYTTVTHRMPGCRWCTSKGITMGQFYAADCPRGYEKARQDCDDENCYWCHNRTYEKDEVKIICYEIKVTAADFASKNGHNFVGNENYYVMPLELYTKVKDRVPEDIGVICYLSRTNYDSKLRRKKDAEFRIVSDEVKIGLIMSTFKRMRREDTL